jgi:hypothetical protein
MKESIEKVVFMPHAKNRMEERRVTEAQATATVMTPDKKTSQRIGNRGGKVYLCSKLYEKTKLFVSTEIVGKTAFVITVFWDNGQT